MHGACVCIWSLYANGAAPVGRCTGRVMGTRFAAHTPREHEHGVCSGRGSKMRLKTNLLLRVSSVLSDRVTVALQGFALHTAAVRHRRFAPRIQHRRRGAFTDAQALKSKTFAYNARPRLSPLPLCLRFNADALQHRSAELFLAQRAGFERICVQRTPPLFARVQHACRSDLPEVRPTHSRCARPPPRYACAVFMSCLLCCG